MIPNRVIPKKPTLRCIVFKILKNKNLESNERKNISLSKKAICLTVDFLLKTMAVRRNWHLFKGWKKWTVNPEFYIQGIFCRTLEKIQMLSNETNKQKLLEIVTTRPALRIRTQGCSPAPDSKTASLIRGKSSSLCLVQRHRHFKYFIHH